jgi:4-amino-4-deoxy-L-arabinose transferase-like glycosyltransferase
LNPASRFSSSRDWLLLAGFCGFLFFYGLASFGLIGADEPRYAQVAREMSAAHDWITPLLGGKPWLEKPPLYYWQAMLAYAAFGAGDWSARLPSAADASLMVAAIYLFLRRFCSGFELDGALMTASSAGVIGFARAASMDMPLAATLTMALLAWYGWRDSGRRLHLALFYVFLGLGVLAKGPIAPFLAAAIIVIFSLAMRDARLLRRTLWLPGIFLFCAVVLPWYIAVEIRNPEFFRVFILEHNFARFGTNLYHHKEAFWYYLPVVLMAALPWTIFMVAALIDNLRAWWASGRKLSSEDALSAFLVIWLVVPVVFFSISQSKLPGYILPALPAATLLLCAYLREQATANAPPGILRIVLHSAAAALLLVPALTVGYIVLQHRLSWGRATGIFLALAAVLFAGLTAVLKSYGLRVLRTSTLLAVLLAVAIAIQRGAPLVDATLSLRPVAIRALQLESKPLPFAIFLLPRESEYGLQFYFNQALGRYELGQIPAEEHMVVVAEQGSQERMARRSAGRRYLYLGNFAAQHVDYYWVAAK